MGNTIHQYGSGDNIAGDKVIGDKVMGDKMGTQVHWRQHWQSGQ